MQYVVSIVFSSLFDDVSLATLLANQIKKYASRNWTFVNATTARNEDCRDLLWLVEKWAED